MSHAWEPNPAAGFVCGQCGLVDPSPDDDDPRCRLCGAGKSKHPMGQSFFLGAHDFIECVPGRQRGGHPAVAV